MKKIFAFLAILAFTIGVKAQTVCIFFDNFNGPTVNAADWKIPTWMGPNDGTFVGRTQFRCSQNANLPPINNGQVYINLETFNPTGFSLYGTDLMSTKRFSQGNGLIFTIRAKINTPVIGGIVGGIFLYDLIPPSSTLHDEIDFELLTNQLGYIHNNVYANDPLGIGYPDSSSTSTITDYHTYVMKWLPNEVIWLVDGVVVRIETTNLPIGPMRLHLNMWAPATEWSSAYNDSLQPVNNLAANTIYSMLIDSVRVDSITNITTVVPIQKTTSEISFSPNPAKDRITFTTTKPMWVSVYDMKGSKFIHKEVTGELSLSELAPGVYIIKYGDELINTKKRLVIY